MIYKLRLLLLLLPFYLLIACGTETPFPRCVSPDNFGTTNTVSISAYISNSSQLDQLRGNDGKGNVGFKPDHVSRWKYTGLVTNGEPISLKTVGMWTSWAKNNNKYTTKPGLVDIIDESDEDAKSKYYNSVIPMDRICGPYLKTEKTLSSGRRVSCEYVDDSIEDKTKGSYGNPCWFKDGYGAYMLIQRTNQPGETDEPNKTFDLMKMPISPVAHLGYKSAEEGGKGMFSSAETPIKDSQGNEVKLEAGWPIYVKIYDRYYFDNAGGYAFEFMSGVRSDKSAHIFEDVRKKVRGVFDSAGESMFKRIAANPVFKNLIFSLITLMIIITSLSYIFGMVQQPMQDLITRIFKIALMLLLISPSSWDFFYNHFLALFLKGVDMIIGLINSHSGANYNPEAPFAFMDIMIKEKIWADTVWRVKMPALAVSSFLGSFGIVTIVIAAIVYTILCAYAFVIYLTAFIAITLLMGIMPIMLIGILFNRFKSLFDGWLSLSIGFSLQSILVFTLISLFGSIMMQYYYRMLGFTACYNDWIRIKLCIPGLEWCLLDKSYASWTPGQEFIPKVVGITSEFNVGNYSGGKSRYKFTGGGSIIRVPPNYEELDFRYVDYPYLDPDINTSSPSGEFSVRDGSPFKSLVSMYYSLIAAHNDHAIARIVEEMNSEIKRLCSSGIVNGFSDSANCSSEVAEVQQDVNGRINRLCGNRDLQSREDEIKLIRKDINSKIRKLCPITNGLQDCDIFTLGGIESIGDKLKELISSNGRNTYRENCTGSETLKEFLISQIKKINHISSIYMPSISYDHEEGVFLTTKASVDYIVGKLCESNKGNLGDLGNEHTLDNIFEDFRLLNSQIDILNILDESNIRHLENFNIGNLTWRGLLGVIKDMAAIDKEFRDVIDTGSLRNESDSEKGKMKECFAILKGESNLGKVKECLSNVKLSVAESCENRATEVQASVNSEISEIGGALCQSANSSKCINAYIAIDNIRDDIKYKKYADAKNKMRDLLKNFIDRNDIIDGTSLNDLEKQYDYNIIKEIESGNLIMWSELFGIILCAFLIWQMRLFVQQIGTALSGGSMMSKQVGSAYSQGPLDTLAGLAGFFNPTSAIGKILQAPKEIAENRFAIYKGLASAGGGALETLKSRVPILGKTIDTMINVTGAITHSDASQIKDSIDSRENFKRYHHIRTGIGAHLGFSLSDGLGYTAKHGVDKMFGKTEQGFFGSIQQDHASFMEKLKDEFNLSQDKASSYLPKGKNDTNPFSKESPIDNSLSTNEKGEVIANEEHFKDAFEKKSSLSKQLDRENDQVARQDLQNKLSSIDQALENFKQNVGSNRFNQMLEEAKAKTELGSLDMQNRLLNAENNLQMPNLDSEIGSQVVLDTDATVSRHDDMLQRANAENYNTIDGSTSDNSIIGELRDGDSSQLNKEKTEPNIEEVSRVNPDMNNDNLVNEQEVSRMIADDFSLPTQESAFDSSENSNNDFFNPFSKSDSDNADHSSERGQESITQDNGRDRKDSGNLDNNAESFSGENSSYQTSGEKGQEGIANYDLNQSNNANSMAGEDYSLPFQDSSFDSDENLNNDLFNPFAKSGSDNVDQRGQESYQESMIQDNEGKDKQDVSSHTVNFSDGDSPFGGDVGVNSDQISDSKLSTQEDMSFAASDSGGANQIGEMNDQESIIENNEYQEGIANYDSNQGNNADSMAEEDYSFDSDENLNKDSFNIFTKSDSDNVAHSNVGNHQEQVIEDSELSSSHSHTAVDLGANNGPTDDHDGKMLSQIEESGTKEKTSLAEQKGTSPDQVLSHQGPSMVSYAKKRKDKGKSSKSSSSKKELSYEYGLEDDNLSDDIADKEISVSRQTGISDESLTRMKSELSGIEKELKKLNEEIDRRSKNGEDISQLEKKKLEQEQRRNTLSQSLE